MTIGTPSAKLINFLTAQAKCVRRPPIHSIKQIKKQKRGYLKKKVPVPTPELTSLMIQWQHTEYISRVKKWCWLHFTNILGVLMGAAWSYQPTRKHNITL